MANVARNRTIPVVGASGTNETEHEQSSIAVIAISAVNPSRLPKALVAGVAALVAVLIAIVVLIVTSGGAIVASALFGSSGTATIDIRLGGTPTYSGAFGSDQFAGSVIGAAGANTGEFVTSLTGTLGGTGFALTASASSSQNTGGTSLPVIVFDVSGDYGSLTVRGTLTWELSTSSQSNGLQMTVHGTVGSHTLNASGTVSGSGQTLVGTFHYSVS